MIQTLEFTDQDFKATSITIFTKVKENSLAINQKVGNIYNRRDCLQRKSSGNYKIPPRTDK